MLGVVDLSVWRSPKWMFGYMWRPAARLDRAGAGAALFERNNKRTDVLLLFLLNPYRAPLRSPDIDPQSTARLWNFTYSGR